MIADMRLRTYFSLHHAQMAAYHARVAQSLEVNESEESAIALSAHVSAAVISAGAFMDATANEVAENSKRPGKDVKGRPASLLRLNELLEAANVPAIDYIDPLWVNAQTLIELRNRLIHYEYDWLDEGTANMIGPGALNVSPLQEKLRAAFTYLPLTVGYIPRFLSPDCAAWAVQSAVAFLDEFYCRLNQTPSHDHLRHRIKVSRP
ncbi:hypothetical protein [Stenotrophomonas ginsengisoli]|nr:hypothetical protein [Stenotrophomonas ginsengisoli]